MSIHSYVRITNHKVVKDGNVIHEYHQLDDLYERLGINYPKFFKMDRLSKAGIIAAELLIDQPLNVSTAVILSNSSSSIDTDKRYWETVKSQASPSLFVYTLPNIVIGEICIRYGLKGETIFFVSPEFDAEWMTSYADGVLLENAKACIIGWVEVVGDHTDVLLYLADRSEAGKLPHTPSTVSEIYRLWNS